MCLLAAAPLASASSLSMPPEGVQAGSQNHLEQIGPTRPRGRLMHGYMLISAFSLLSILAEVAEAVLLYIHTCVRVHAHVALPSASMTSLLSPRLSVFKSLLLKLKYS